MQTFVTNGQDVPEPAVPQGSGFLRHGVVHWAQDYMGTLNCNLYRCSIATWQSTEKHFCDKTIQARLC